MCEKALGGFVLRIACEEVLLSSCGFGGFQVFDIGFEWGGPCEFGDEDRYIHFYFYFVLHREVYMLRLYKLVTPRSVLFYWSHSWSSP